MHKLVVDEGKTVQSVDFGELSSLTLKEDRVKVGNSYKYVHGTAPTAEGIYTYTVNVANSGGDIVKVPVKFVVSSMLQSPTPMMGWLSWNWFAKEISHDKMVDIARGMKQHQLFEVGYNTIVLDDGWATRKPTKQNSPSTPENFPKASTDSKQHSEPFILQSSSASIAMRVA